MFIAMPAHDHCVYQLLNRAGEVIYVGSSSALFTRLGNHAKIKDWWSSVRGITVESFPTVDEMLDRETELIELLDPVHNDLLGTAKALSMATALLGRKITREDVRLYVLTELGTAPAPTAIAPAPRPEGATTLRDYAAATGENLGALRMRVNRAGLEPVGQEGTANLFQEIDLMALAPADS